MKQHIKWHKRRVKYKVLVLILYYNVQVTPTGNITFYCPSKNVLLGSVLFNVPNAMPLIVQVTTLIKSKA